MSEKDRLKRIERGVNALPSQGKNVFLCWAAAVAGVPLDKEASFNELESKITTLESSTAKRVLEDLELCLEEVRRRPTEMV